ncbi:hypothetical protein E2562_036392 [Oryza meyeriana var. granulata]|uniref:Uncharacterized protein n=1 Tax=Oryza meyeriana var. granulata TaxID=110450 RepID=A0A6G1CX93_9ORYZ|nr:hypothetical protein E2562_036392 [Oryza meyeriana var. granulata]
MKEGGRGIQLEAVLVVKEEEEEGIEDGIMWPLWTLPLVRREACWRWDWVGCGTDGGGCLSVGAQRTMAVQMGRKICKKNQAWCSTMRHHHTPA